MATTATGTIKTDRTVSTLDGSYTYAEESVWLDDLQLESNLDANSNKITNVTDPTTAQDAATKAYVDAQIAPIDTIDELLPTQTSNSGKYLGTNGTAASWSYPTKLVRYLETTITASPDVAGGAEAISFEFSVPAAGWADLEYVTISNAIFKYFTTDGVVTETRRIIYDDQDGTPVTSQIAAGLGMPNNANTYYMPCQSYIVRIGTHLYFKNEPVFTNMSLTDASTNGFAIGDMVDLGEPDFTKVIDIQFAHILSAESASAIIQCLGVQVTQHKLS